MNIKMIQIKSHLSYIVILFAILSLNGCFPYHFTQKPGVSGTIIDADTNQPIQGAKISLTTYSFPDQNEKIEEIETQKDGSFYISAEQDWSIYIVPLDPGPIKARINVEVNGYEDYEKEFYINTMGPAITKYKNILLEQTQ